MAAVAFLAAAVAFPLAAVAFPLAVVALGFAVGREALAGAGARARVERERGRAMGRSSATPPVRRNVGRANLADMNGAASPAH